jgi:predicted benzoate:H+ symporter BenE
MSFSPNDSIAAARRVFADGSPRFLVVHCAVLFALLGLAIGNSGTSALISETVQAEFVAPDLGAAAPMQLARPAVETRTARAN